MGLGILIGKIISFSFNFPIRILLPSSMNPSHPPPDPIPDHPANTMNYLKKTKDRPVV
jgi:hypothetical protein